MKLGTAVTVLLSSAVTAAALVGAFFVGIEFGQGIPARHPPAHGEVRLELTINTRDGRQAEIVVYETAPGRIYVSSAPK